MSLLLISKTQTDRHINDGTGDGNRSRYQGKVVPSNRLLADGGGVGVISIWIEAYWDAHIWCDIWRDRKAQSQEGEICSCNEVLSTSGDLYQNICICANCRGWEWQTGVQIRHYKPRCVSTWICAKECEFAAWKVNCDLDNAYL